MPLIYKITKKSANVNVAFINVRKLCNKLNIINLFVQFHSIDILCLSETWCTEEDIHFMTINGFTNVSYFNRKRHEKGGVAIFVRDNIVKQVKALEYFSAISVEMDVELCGILLTTGNEKICIISTYRRPAGELDVFFDTFFSAIDYASTYDSMIVGGDMNIDGLHPNKLVFKKLADVTELFGLNKCHSGPTRIFTDKNGKTSILELD